MATSSSFDFISSLAVKPWRQKTGNGTAGTGTQQFNLEHIGYLVGLSRPPAGPFRFGHHRGGRKVARWTLEANEVSRVPRGGGLFRFLPTLLSLLGRFASWKPAFSRYFSANVRYMCSDYGQPTQGAARTCVLARGVLSVENPRFLDISRQSGLTCSDHGYPARRVARAAEAGDSPRSCSTRSGTGIGDAVRYHVVDFAFC